MATAPVGPNSSTHPKEYAAFRRVAKGKTYGQVDELKKAWELLGS